MKVRMFWRRSSCFADGLSSRIEPAAEGTKPLARRRTSHQVLREAELEREVRRRPPPLEEPLELGPAPGSGLRPFAVGAALRIWVPNEESGCRTSLVPKRVWASVARNPRRPRCPSGRFAEDTRSPPTGTVERFAGAASWAQARRRANRRERSRRSRCRESVEASWGA